MKRRSFLAPLAALAASTSLFAPVQGAEKASSPRTQAIADSPRFAPAPQIQVVGAPTDVAAIQGVYGFVAQLPKDVESFSASYHLHDLWAGLADSKWADTLLNLPPVKQDRQIQRVIEQWNSPQAFKGRGLAEAVFGQEWVVATPAGFSDKVQPLLQAYAKFSEVYAQHALLAMISGKTMGPQDFQEMMKDGAPELIPAFAKAEVPPLLFVAKAVKEKDTIDAGLGQLLEQAGTAQHAGIEVGKFTVGGKFDFQSISVIVKDLITPVQEQQMKMQFKELLGGEDEAAKVLAEIKGKRVELAFGWVGDYLVVSVGSNHEHVKLAGTPADSALAVPEVATRAAAYAAKKPLGLSYVSKGMMDKFTSKIEFAQAFATAADQVRDLIKNPAIIDAMKADVKKLEEKAQAIFNPVYDSQVAVSYWEAGLHGETFGGFMDTMIDSSKPLVFSSLASPATFLLCDGRSSALSRKAMDFVEDAAGTAYGWYQKYGTSVVPENQRQGAALIEATAIPMIKAAWGSIRSLGQALGDESALVINLDGTMPNVQDLPPFLEGAKIPRVALVAELKDRAALSEAWKGFSGIIKQVAALAAEKFPQGLPEPQMKKDGDLELYYVPLPVETGDVLPHIAVSKNRWILSTSPSLSKEIAAKAPGVGEPLGRDWRVNFGAVWDFADAWLTRVDRNAEAMLGSGDAREFQQARPIISSVLKLARSVQSAEMREFEEAGKARSSVYLKLEDIK